MRSLIYTILRKLRGAHCVLVFFFSPPLSPFSQNLIIGHMALLKQSRTGRHVLSAVPSGSEERQPVQGSGPGNFFLSNNQLEVSLPMESSGAELSEAPEMLVLCRTWKSTLTREGVRPFARVLSPAPRRPPTRSLHPSRPLLPRQEVSHSLVWP